MGTHALMAWVNVPPKPENCFVVVNSHFLEICSSHEYMKNDVGTLPHVLGCKIMTL